MKKRLNLIQVFRGFAALLVVIYHLSNSAPSYFHTNLLGNFFSGGYLGVDFFFVLSGFIITYMHFNDLVNKTNKLMFLKKRIVRIYPIYWILASVQLLLLILVSHGKAAHLDHEMNLKSANEWGYILGSYLLIKIHYKFFLGVAWTLAYEVLFYLVFFIGIWLGFKRAKYMALVWLVCIVINSILQNYGEGVSLLIFNERIVLFLAGCLIAYLIIKEYVISRSMLITLLALSLTIVYLVAYPDKLDRTAGLFLLSITIGIMLYGIVLIDLQKSYKYPKLLLLMGEASYSIYLAHVLFLSALLRTFKTIMLKLQITNFYAVQGMILLLFAVTIACCVVVYMFVEAPLLQYCQNKFIRKESKQNKPTVASA